MASAVDKPIEGRKVLLRGPVEESQRRFNFLSLDPNIIFGSNGDTDTPSTHGASVLVFNPLTSECQCMILPAAYWSIGAEGKRYVYRDPTLSQSPVKFALVKGGKVKVLAKGTGLTGVTVNETQQDEIAVHFTSGSGSKLCTHFAGLTVRVDQPGAFIAVNATPPPACPAEPVACTPCAPPIVP